MPTSPVAGRRLAFGLITSVLVTFAVLLGVARQQPGTIAGRVTDASGTPVPGVDIGVGTAQGRRLQKVVSRSVAPARIGRAGARS